ncbi:hypothetical protein B0I35DRAFT_510601 [Stachybotrys elegans]|uniref:FAD-binding PCMH-type domain-containing protein n=1 Tax=Stachybotrys elegans TaxID=80388 RepID=A0A8K0SZ00_9HYPO|nr:hypothetical protein B0I35DRAFT_510601 [Stachybotrys elegans]
MAGYSQALASTLLLLIGAYIWYLRWQDAARRREESEEDPDAVLRDLPEPTELAKALKASLPGNVLFPTDAPLFRQVLDSYWARHLRDVIPACFVRPATVAQLQEAVRLIAEEHRRRGGKEGPGEELFTIKAGGASPAIGGSTVKGGVVIDLALFREVTVSEDERSVKVGSGLKWIDVYVRLAERGLTAPGGRTSPVGVGGLSLQGGLSFYTPIYGFVCSSVLAYDVVLADGTAVMASPTSHADLFRALKGGASNFGIVTGFTLPCFGAGDIWFGCLYLPLQDRGLVRAFYDWTQETRRPGGFDAAASGPVTCFGYTRGLYLGVNYLAYTQPPRDGGWPEYWRKSAFYKQWPIYSTARVRPIVQAVSELSEPSPPGSFNVMATTTVKSDLDTLMHAYEAYLDLAREARPISGIVVSLVFQPILPQWAGKGAANVLGLEGTAEPLVIVELSVTWEGAGGGDARGATRRAVERMEAFAAARGTAHRYRFANYCAEWQDPMAGYGEANLEFMRRVSARYDAEGLFQRARRGPFRLGG